MKILIKSALIADPQSPFNGLKNDILVDKGLVVDIAPVIDADADRTIEYKDIYISPGWVDTFANLGEPGFEQKETLDTGIKAAAAGGFTHVFTMPNMNPCIHNKSGIDFLTRNNNSSAVTICPIGAVSKNCKAVELAEMYDMFQAGAIAFSDGLQPIQSADIMIKALQYVKAINRTIIQVPIDSTISHNGLMNEGLVSTRLGMQGIPDIGEEIIVMRDMKLNEYAESNLHITGISARRALNYILANRTNSCTTCSVSPFHLNFCEDNLSGYDTNLKLLTPLRTIEDKKYLQQAFRNGDIDCIATHHLPHETDSKVTEFEVALPGSISLETAYAAINTAVPGISMDILINILAINPRRIFNLPAVKIDINAPACITLFDPYKSWVFMEKDIQSQSKNTPYLGSTFIGKVLGIIHNNKLVFQNE